MDVTIANCDNYDSSSVDKAVGELFDNLGGTAKILGGAKRVFIKANLVRQMPPDKAATTHPSVIAAVAKKIIAETGAEVIVGDSPGGLYTAAHMAAVYKTCGMTDACEASGAKLNDDFGYSSVAVDGAVIKRMDCIDAFLKADAVINVCKFKTHSLTGYSGCVKNLFGLIPGLMKVEMHTRFSDLGPFCDALIDIERFAAAKINLHIIDAVTGMHKNGPTAGEPIFIGKLIASRDAYFADIIAERMFCDDVMKMPVIMKAAERGVIAKPVGEIVCGAPVEKIDGFEGVDVGSMALYRYPKFIRKFIKNISSRKVKIKKDTCRGCGKCAVHCPNKAITIRDKKARIKQSQCIRCYCCQELCPFLSVKLTKPLGYRVFRAFSGGRRSK